MHDLETISRISNLICGLRFNYNGLSIELTEQIAHEIRNEVRRKGKFLIKFSNFFKSNFILDKKIYRCTNHSD